MISSKDDLNQQQQQQQWQDGSYSDADWDNYDDDEPVLDDRDSGKDLKQTTVKPAVADELPDKVPDKDFNKDPEKETSKNLDNAGGMVEPIQKDNSQENIFENIKEENKKTREKDYELNSQTITKERTSAVDEDRNFDYSNKGGQQQAQKIEYGDVDDEDFDYEDDGFGFEDDYEDSNGLAQSKQNNKISQLGKQSIDDIVSIFIS